MKKENINIPIGFVKGSGISYRGSIPKIKKSQNILQPIFEAITNAFEAIKLLNNNSKGRIHITLNKGQKLFSEEDKGYSFKSITIADTGKGFDNIEFERFCNLNDDSKPFFNKGSGRIQYIHLFDKTEFKSVFADENSTTGFKKRAFALSGSEAFFKQNAIVKHESLTDTNDNHTGTIVTFKTLLNKSDANYYNSLSIETLRKELIDRYLAYFCENRSCLPEIMFETLVNGVKDGDSIYITDQDIPQLYKENDVKVHYCKFSSDGKKVEKSCRFEIFSLKGFKINKCKLANNSLNITSKGEVARHLKLDAIAKEDHVGDYRYLFLISGTFFNKKDSDNRGVLDIPTLDEFKNNNVLDFDQSTNEDSEQIVLDNIRETANNTIKNNYTEIVEHNKQYQEEVIELESMFLLDPKSVKDAKIKPGDSVKVILEKVYKADAMRSAMKDTEIKSRLERLGKLNPNKGAEFQKDFKEEVLELTKLIPLQNKMALTHYVARRKLALNVFSKVLSKKLDCQNNSKTIDEALIHNLLFQKGSVNSEDSNLWMINEDFIYFDGLSEKQLNKVEINGELLFKEQFEIEIDKYLNSLDENRKIKRPDVLLFPDEGKCIIIEFKSPNVNARNHLTQIDFYAGLIRNFTQDQFQITTFYGYLIGENIEPNDVLLTVGRYEEAYNFDYIYRPSEPVRGLYGRTNGSLYTEVLKYSTLLKRAELRNRIFTDKLFNIKK